MFHGFVRKSALLLSMPLSSCPRWLLDPSRIGRSRSRGPGGGAGAAGLQRQMGHVLFDRSQVMMQVSWNLGGRELHTVLHHAVRKRPLPYAAQPRYTFIYRLVGALVLEQQLDITNVNKHIMVLLVNKTLTHRHVNARFTNKAPTIMVSRLYEQLLSSTPGFVDARARLASTLAVLATSSTGKPRVRMTSATACPLGATRVLSVAPDNTMWLTSPKRVETRVT